MLWSTINLGDAMLAGQLLSDIERQFLDFYASSEEADDMALFIRHISEGQLHCQTHLYFSPSVAGFATQLGAVTCATPDPDDLGLLVGSYTFR